MRLIDADAAYKAACEGADNWDGGCSPYRDDCIREEMDKVPTASPWRRVEDELPKEPGEFGEIVLACNDVGTVNAAYLLSNGKWYAANNTTYDEWTWMPNVTHWMPLPEPPMEDA